MTQLITAALVLAEGEWRRDWSIAVEGGRVVAAGPRSELASQFPDARADDWGDMAVVPGGVNGHGHTFQILVRGFGDDVAFGSWMGDLVIPTAVSLDRKGIGLGAKLDFAEMLRAGITTAVEFFNIHDGGNENAMAVVDAAEEVGMRTVIARCMFDEAGPDRYTESPAEFERGFRELAGELEGNDLAYAQPGPHSVLKASAEMLELGDGLARELGVPCHIHVADNAGECEVSRERFGASPVGYLRNLGVLNDHTLAVHAVAVDEADLDMLADAGSAVVHNPSTNAFLGGGIAPLAGMLERGIEVCLGTDAGGANNRQSLFEEMRMASLLAKATARDATVMTAEEALRLGTEAGGRVLGLPVGRIAPGYFADLVGVDLNALSMQPRATATHNLVYSMQPDAIDKVALGGELVVDGGELLRVDADELVREVSDLTAGWKPIAGSHPLAQQP